MNRIRVGLAGLGTVGSGFVKLLHQSRHTIRQRTGINIELVRVVELDKRRLKGLPLDQAQWSANLDDILKAADVDIVVELIGGTGVSREFILKAMKSRKHVVTANKALLAEHFSEIFSAADRNGVNIGFEASVAGGIPIIKILQESFLTNRIKKIYGILNGTTNYILTKMSLDNMDFASALKEAQKKGFAEADPTLDIDGLDAAHKALILCNLAFQVDVNFKDVMVSGIRNFDVSDIHYARELGYVVKLLAVSRLVKDGQIVTYVEPSLIPFKHLLASVNYEYNAIYIDGEAVGESVFYGKGAGSMPTANSVLSDVIDLARHIVAGTKVWHYRNLRKPDSTVNKNIMNEYYLRFMTADKPGVLGRIASILGKYGISISSCVQKDLDARVTAVVMTTHFCRKQDLESAVAYIRKNVRDVKAPIVVLNIR